MQTCEIAAQLLVVIAGRHAQVLIGHGVADHLELAEQTGFEIGWDAARAHILHEEGSKPVVPKTHEHGGAPSMGVGAAQ
jgi:hypothetical protein